MWVIRLQYLIACGEIVKEGNKVRRDRRAVTETKKNGRGRYINFEPKNIQIRDSRSLSRAIGVVMLQ